MLAIFAKAEDVKEACEPLLSGLKTELEENGEKAKADKVVLVFSSNCALAYSTYVPRGQQPPGTCFKSHYHTEQLSVTMSSRLVRKMGDPFVRKASGGLAAKEGLDAPTDSHILLVNFAGAMAKVRWTKTQNVMKALRGLRMAGGLTAGRRVSVTGLVPSASPSGNATPEPEAPAPPDAGAAGSSSAPNLPPEKVVRECLQGLVGPYACIVSDAVRGFMLLARSADGAASLSWGVHAQTGFVCAAESDGMPEGVLAVPFPAGCFALVALNATALPPVADIGSSEAARPPLKVLPTGSEAAVATSIKMMPVADLGASADPSAAAA